MSGAHFRIDQATNPIPTGTTDTSRNDLWMNRTMNLVATDTVTGTPVWTLLSGPLGASLTLTNSTTNTATLAAPQPGSYLCQYNVGDGLGANTKTFSFRITYDTNGLLIDDGQTDPAYQEASGADNAGGNARGWDARTSAIYRRVVPLVLSAALLDQRTALLHTQVQLAGYYTTGDGGGQGFVWNPTSTAAHDYGNVRQPGFGTGAAVATGRWIAPSSYSVDVKKYGAVGDWQTISGCGTTAASRVITCAAAATSWVGKNITVTTAGAADSSGRQRPLQGVVASVVVGVSATLTGGSPAASFTVAAQGGQLFTNDSVAFNRAAAALNTLGGGDLIIPPTSGRYGLIDALTISSLLGFSGNITIRGAGRQSALQIQDGGWDIDAAHDGQRFAAINFYNVNNCRVTNLAVYGSLDCFQNGDYLHIPGCVYFASCGDCTVDHCFFENNQAYAIFGSRTTGDTGALLMQRMHVHDNVFRNIVYPSTLSGEVNAGNTIEAAGHHHKWYNNRFIKCGAPMNAAGDHCEIAGNKGVDCLGLIIACGDSFSVAGNSVHDNEFTTTLTADNIFNTTIVPTIQGIAIQPPDPGEEPCRIYNNYFFLDIQNATMAVNRTVNGFSWETANNTHLSYNKFHCRVAVNVATPQHLIGFASNGNTPTSSQLSHNEVLFFNDGGVISNGVAGGYTYGSTGEGNHVLFSKHNRCTGATGTGMFAYNYSAGGGHLKLRVEGDTYTAGACTMGLGGINSINKPIYLGYDDTLPASGVDSPMNFGGLPNVADSTGSALLFRKGAGSGDLVGSSVRDEHVSGAAAINATKINFVGLPLTLDEIDVGGHIYANGTKSDQIQFAVVGNAGQTTPLVQLRNSGSAVLWQIGADASSIAWGSVVSNPTFYQLSGAGDGGPVRFRGQYGGGANGAGGFLVLGGGIRAGAGLRGGVQIGMNGGGEVMLECVELATNRRVVALCCGTPVTTGNMPANTGDRVAFMADVGTPPSASPFNGMILYVDNTTHSLMGKTHSGFVNTISPNSVVWSIAQTELAFQEGIGDILIHQPISTTGNGSGMRIDAQNGKATGNTDGGMLILAGGLQNGSGAYGHVQLWSGGSAVLDVGPTSVVQSQPFFTFKENVASPFISQATATTSNNGTNMAVSAQSAKVGGGGNGGQLQLISGAKDGAGSIGEILLRPGGTTAVTVTTTETTLAQSFFSFEKTATPVISQKALTSGTSGHTMQVAAQDAFPTGGGFGAPLQLKGGLGDAGDGTHGDVVVMPGGSTRFSFRKYAAGTAIVIATYGGTPEENITGTHGDLIIDSTNDNIYIKSTVSGTTGWKLITREP